VRDGGCRFPSCDRPVAWCDAHHLRHWLHGGATDLGNLLWLCRGHHHAVHEGGWQLHGHPTAPSPPPHPTDDDPPPHNAAGWVAADQPAAVSERSMSGASRLRRARMPGTVSSAAVLTITHTAPTQRVASTPMRAATGPTTA
jgi:hypothetical protein